MRPRSALPLVLAAWLATCGVGYGAESSVVVASSDAREGEFQPREGATIPLSRDGKVWWRVTARHTLDVGEAPQLVLSDVFLLQADVWFPGRHSPERHVNYGPDADERFSTRGLAIALPGGIAAGDAIHLQLRARGIAPIRPSIETLAETRHRDRRHGQIRSALLTAMAVTCVLAVGFGLGLGERGYLYFAAMVLCQMTHFALIGGEIRHAPLIDGALERNLQGVRVAGSLGTIASIAFIRMYLELATRQPRMSRLLLACCLVLGFVAVAALLTTSSWTATLGNFGVLAAGTLLTIATVRGCIARQREAWFVLVAFVPAIVFAMLRVFEALGWLVGPSWLSYLFPGSFAFASLMLTLGLTDRMMRMRRERHDAVLQAQQRARQLATASHDIRQPLLALRATLARLTDDGRLVPAVAERFRNNLEYLDKLAAEYTAGGRAVPQPLNRDEPKVEPLPVELLLRNIELMFRDEAEGKGLEFRVKTSAAAVSVDAMATMRIISNLVANAVKYTHSGKVLIGCRHHRERIAIVVADTGPGIAPAELARVLGEGERGSSAAQTEGSGLGLSIATRLATQHGFGFRVDSVPGRGTLFSVELPLARRPSPSVASPGRRSSSRLD